MSDLARIVHMAAVDSGFRTALIADPTSALSQRGLQATPEELEILSEMNHLLALPTGELLERLLPIADGPEQVWRGYSLASRHATLAG